MVKKNGLRESDGGLDLKARILIQNGRLSHASFQRVEAYRSKAS